MVRTKPLPTGMSGPRPVVLSGPSGAGKSTLLRRLLQEHGGVFGFSVSREYLGLDHSCPLSPPVAPPLPVTRCSPNPVHAVHPSPLSLGAVCSAWPCQHQAGSHILASEPLLPQGSLGWGCRAMGSMWGDCFSPRYHKGPSAWRGEWQRSVGCQALAVGMVWGGTGCHGGGVGCQALAVVGRHWGDPWDQKASEACLLLPVHLGGIPD